MAEWLAIEMAELIERGLEWTRHQGGDALRVEEKPNALLEFDGRIFRASPLGLALIGRAGDPKAALTKWMEASPRYPGNAVGAAAYLLGMPVALARLIELNHRHGLTAGGITRRLRRGTLGMAFGGEKAATPGVTSQSVW